VTRRAILPLADLAKRVAAIEPGTGKTLEPKAELRELEVLETRFADLVGRFEQALAREKQFVAHASHELRTPLTVVRAEIEALANTDPGLRAALASLCRLESLIDALLWFAKAQTSFNTQEMDVVNLADVLGHQLLEVQRAHASRAISVRLPDEALVRGDEKLLASATANLLDNAIKYGGEAEIEVSLQRESENLVLRVANDGPRIPQGLRTRLFVPFVRGQHSVPGFGLGLAFSRAVARAHGGDIVLADGENERTTLLLRLPLVGWNDEVSAG
jgi:signal transduction histidine kinase